MSKISAAHVSATLAKAGHLRASEPDERESGFVVSIGGVENLGPTVIVAYQDYDYGFTNAEQEAAAPVIKAAFDGYAATLHNARYTVEDWMRYDGVRLGLFVTGRQS
jgi:hypothetical protein